MTRPLHTCRTARGSHARRVQQGCGPRTPAPPGPPLAGPRRRLTLCSSSARSRAPRSAGSITVAVMPILGRTWGRGGAAHREPQARQAGIQQPAGRRGIRSGERGAAVPWEPAGSRGASGAGHGCAAHRLDELPRAAVAVGGGHNVPASRHQRQQHLQRCGPRRERQMHISQARKGWGTVHAELACRVISTLQLWWRPCLPCLHAQLSWLRCDSQAAARVCHAQHLRSAPWLAGATSAPVPCGCCAACLPACLQLCSQTAARCGATRLAASSSAQRPAPTVVAEFMPEDDTRQSSAPSSSRIFSSQARVVGLP